jgi:hypothetical protein
MQINMDPLTTTIPRTGTYGDMPFPVTLVDVPRMTVVPQVTTTEALSPLRINAIDYVEDKWVTIEEGEMFYHIFKKALQQGRKVQFSVKGLELDGVFFDKAICKLYGDFPQAMVDNNIEVVDIEKVDLTELEEMKEMRQYYYYDRPFYDKLIAGIDPILGYNEPAVGEADYVETDDDDRDGETSPYDDDDV